MLHSDGKNGDWVEWRIHFLEFTRLEIGGKWYVISEHFPWRVHYALKRISGKWVDNGSHTDLTNYNFTF